MPRIPSASAHHKVLEAAIELVAEQGIEATSVDAISRKSGVSKATIYKHWQDKDALLLEVMAEVNGVHLRPDFDSGHTREDLIAVLAYRPKEHAATRERIMPHFMVYSARNQEVGLAWRNKVMDPPRRELKQILQAAISRKEITPTLNLDLSLCLLLGPIIYWFVFLRNSEEDPTHLAEGVVDAFLKAFGLPGKQRRK